MKKYLKSKYQKLQSFISTGKLMELGGIYKTDKINQWHSFAGKNYLEIYSMYLEPIKDFKMTMLEIGIRDGSSLRTFRDYFKNGHILGLDINPETAFKENRITTYIGSQSSKEVIDKIFDENPDIMVVLDDGSHVNELTIESFKLIFHKLQKGGYYIIEDLACSYLEDSLEEGIVKGQWPGMHLNDPSIKMVNKRSDMNDFFLKIIKDMDHRKGEVEYVHFWSQLCVIKKVD